MLSTVLKSHVFYKLGRYSSGVGHERFKFPLRNLTKTVGTPIRETPLGDVIKNESILSKTIESWNIEYDDNETSVLKGMKMAQMFTVIIIIITSSDDIQPSTLLSG